MDGVSWSSSRTQESFSRSRTAADTLSRLASFIARADTKPHTQHKRQQQQQHQAHQAHQAQQHHQAHQAQQHHQAHQAHQAQQAQQHHQASYVCPECGKGFPYATDLLQHQEVKHSLPKPHRCSSCLQEFSLRSSLQLHRCSHSSSLCDGESEGPPCPTCSPDPVPPPHRQPPLLDISPYACAPCGRGFSHKQALLHHQQAGCSEPASPSDIVDASSLPDDSPAGSEADSTQSDSSETLLGSGSSSRALSVCHFCSKMFRTKVGLQRHSESSHAEEAPRPPQGARSRAGTLNGDLLIKTKPRKKLLNCRSCDMVFRRTSELYMHRKEKHSREKQTRREPRPAARKRRRRAGTYPCQVCGKVFIHHLSLRAHYKQHTHSNFTTITNQPVESTAKDSQRPNHKVIVEKKAGPGRPRKVPRLESKVQDPGRRSREVPDEEEEEEEEVQREFPCPSCAEVFSQQSQLREHVELHQSSVRRRACSVCSDHMDSCRWSGSRRPRPYHCVPCRQAFTALDAFLQHCQEHLRLRVEEDSISEACTQQLLKA
ncbi:zinc finger protein 84 [Centropristis striata]|uniref:zinc finger protein 84 n=1 Tax=Centropristis striata TaxID=184440 RepID=UPI0027DF0728|nr:zinc finger protein 84 [Centropristis striata]XP_059189423.1 zinc finger protein 84 [Centropristis striata]